MSQEVASIPFLVAFDVVEKALDFNAFLDFLKSEHKKDVTIINGFDYADQSRGTSKSSSRSSRLGIYDSSLSIVKGIKNKIESELSKLDASKKKQLAQSEKSKSNSHKSKSKVVQEPPRFDGRIDMLYVIINFPYLPDQLYAMKDNNVCINTFITIKPNYEVPNVPFVNQPKLSAKNPTKKTILGSEYDFTLNTNVYPPARILSLQNSAPDGVTFIEIKPGENFESTFKIIEEQVLKILDVKKDYEIFTETHKIIKLPSFNPSVNMTVLNDYLLFHPNDFLNSLYFQLKEGNWNRLDPAPPETEQQHYDNLFTQMEEQTNRKVVFIEPKEPPDPVFNITNQTFSIHEYLYPLFHWKIDEENAFAIPEIINFFSSIKNVYAYAGSKFESLFSSVNKKHSLGLPLTFFDWEKWTLGADYTNVSETLSEAINNSSLVESFFDKQIGILWILVLNPIPRTMGQVISNYSMPFCIQNLNEFMKNVSDKFKNNDQDSPHLKKSRNLPSPSMIVKEKLDFNLILPSIESRIQNSSQFYHLPLKVSCSESFMSPYCFENGLYVTIFRDVKNDVPTFSYKFLYKNIIEATSTSDSIVFQPVEGIRCNYEFINQVLTVFFNDQSICFDGENLNMMSTNEKNIIITKTGSLIFTNSHDIIIIVHPNGSISRYNNNKWTTVDKDGISLDGINRPHSSYINDQTKSVHMIRSDNIEYNVFQGGKRLIVVDLDCTVEQNDIEKTVTFVIPNFPIIQWSQEKIAFDIDKFNFIIYFGNKNENIKFVSTAITEGYTIKTNGKFVSFTTDVCDSNLSNDSCQFKNTLNNSCQSSQSDIQYLIADSKGIEKVCVLATEDQKNKKKIELFESNWGSLIAIKESIQEQLQLNLHRLFLPRFFLVRQNLSGIEFIRKDTLKTDGYEQRKMFFRHPNGESISVFSLHSMELIPYLFIHFEGLSRTLRANIMKDLRIPKKKSTSTTSKSTSSLNKKKSIQKPENVIENAKNIYDNYLNKDQLFSKALEEQLAVLQTYFIQDNQPEEIVEEPPLIMPVSTPQPRILKMMYDLHKPKIPSNSNNRDILNYWECTESDFGYPIDCSRIETKVLSPRLSLFDPPRNYKPEVDREKLKNNFDDDEAFVTQTEPSIKNPKLNDSLKKSKLNVKTMKDSIDFGDVLANKRVFATLKIQNTGKKPLHFSFSKSEDDTAFRICSIPGILFPGLMITVKVELLPSKAQEINQSFTFQTQFFEMQIPVKANVISERY